MSHISRAFGLNAVTPSLFHPDPLIQNGDIPAVKQNSLGFPKHLDQTSLDEPFGSLSIDSDPDD